MASNLRYFGELQYGDSQDLSVFVDPVDNSLYITYPTIEKTLSYRANSAREKTEAKSLKAFAGKDLTLGKLVSGADSLGRVNKFKCVPFDTFLILVHFEAFHGKSPHREIAQKLLIAGFADSFCSLILEQCGVKLTKDERQQVITFYRHWYHKFQDWVRDTHLAIYGEKPNGDYYRDMATIINKHLFNRKHFYCDRINNADTDQLRVIENFQMHFLTTKTAKSGQDPLQSMRKYIANQEAI